MVLGVLNFICTIGNSVMICLPRKKLSFCFNNLCNLVMELRNEKFESLKYFEVHSVQEKEPRING
jgi:hypothetical protein